MCLLPLIFFFFFLFRLRPQICSSVPAAVRPLRLWKEPLERSHSLIKHSFIRKKFPDFTNSPSLNKIIVLFYFIQTYKQTVTPADEPGLFKVVSFILIVTYVTQRMMLMCLLGLFFCLMLSKQYESKSLRMDPCCRFI